MVVAAERGRLTAKPRPWLVLQADAFNDEHPSITLCLITSELTGAGLFRISVEPSAANGLAGESEVMVDKLFTLGRGSIRQVIGRLEPEAMARVDVALRGWLDL